MKKLLCIAVFAGMFSIGYCQDVKVNINNQETSTNEECPFRINGICSTEDIGGVDVQLVFEKGCNGEKYGATKAVFINYNSFPVTVLYKIHNKDTSDDKDDTVGSMVLGVDGIKEIILVDCSYYNYSTRFRLDGIIVRKLQN